MCEVSLVGSATPEPVSAFLNNRSQVRTPRTEVSTNVFSLKTAVKSVVPSGWETVKGTWFKVENTKLTE